MYLDVKFNLQLQKRAVKHFDTAVLVNPVNRGDIDISKMFLQNYYNDLSTNGMLWYHTEPGKKSAKSTS